MSKQWEAVKSSCQCHGIVYREGDHRVTQVSALILTKVLYMGHLVVNLLGIELNHLLVYLELV